MTVSIVVPAFNEEKLISETLRQIKAAAEAFTFAGMENELIVCDNNSTDRTAELARTAGAQVVFEPVNQIARARNSGAAAARGEWLLFIDADCSPEPALFQDVAVQIQSGKRLAGGSTVKLDNATWGGWLGTKLWNSISRTTRSLAGSFIFCDVAVFRELGGFNETLFASEELDLSARLRKYAVRNGRSLVILHRHPLRTSGRKLELYTRGEYLRFMMRTVFGFGRTLRSAEHCHIWYDGRR